MNTEVGKPLSDELRYMIRKVLSIDDFKQLESDLKASLREQGIKEYEMKNEVVGWRTMQNMTRMRNPQIVTHRNQKAFTPMFALALKRKQKKKEQLQVKLEVKQREAREIKNELETLE